MNRSALLIGLSSMVALAGFAGACSSGTTTNGPDGGGTSSEAGTTKDTGTGLDSSSGGNGDSSAAMGDEACAAEATRAMCGTCCVTNHPTGAKIVQDTVVACACQGTGADGGPPACATECMTTACAGMPADMACKSCLSMSIAQGGPCQAAASNACTANADCLAEQKCIQPCTTKN